LGGVVGVMKGDEVKVSWVGLVQDEEGGAEDYFAWLY
jgi:hypothetical protein